jgi:lipoate-protein ligase A
MQDTWRFLDTGVNTGLLNMETDEALAMDLLRGTGGRTLRVFRWSPWAVSLGHNQRTEEIDANRCAEAGIDIVRRPTGGRAILHAEELTYSVVMPAGSRGVNNVYNDISRALLEGLRAFGVDAGFQRSQPDFRNIYRTAGSIPCFSSSARYEIEINGRKLVGSAQRRYALGRESVVLQHGSILCGPAHIRLADFLRCDVNTREKIRTDLQEKTVCLGDVIGRPVEYGDLAACVRRGFELIWGVRFVSETMTSIEGGVHA